MSNNDYQVHRVFIKEADFEVLILQLPSDEIEDKLAYLAREKGHITKSFYEDVIIATCVANINQLLFSLNQQETDPPDLVVVRAAVVKAILIYNPTLDPDKLIINKNGVVKKMSGNKPKKSEKLLSSNKFWGMSPTDAENEQIKNRTSTIPKAPKDENKKPIEQKDINDLHFDQIQKWWKRIGQYVQVKKFRPEDAESILKNRYFHNRTSFGTFIVSVCVEGFEELFALLDEMGIPNRVAPPLLMHELYELCRSCNEFLTFENAQRLSGNDQEDGSCEGKNNLRRTATAGTMGQYMGDKKGKKKRFKDVPKEDLLKLADNMKVMLIGQDESIDVITDAIQRASVGLKEPEKPIGSFLFAGRTGVGKTKATKVLADELIKGKENLVTIDCSEYSADHEYSKLIGAPSGYVGHESGGILTNAVQKNPFSIIVFDEVEKASNKVHELLLQILEEGRLTDGKGKTVSFSDSVIILTSNVGVNEIDNIKKTIGFGDVAKITEDKKNAALDEALKKKFKPEFLNRIGAVVHFNSLSKEDYMRIIDIELYKLNENLRNNDTEYKELWLKFDKRIRNMVYEKGIDTEYGARPLKRCIEQMVSTPLARKLLSDEVATNSIISISAKKGESVFKFKNPKKKNNKVEEKPFYLEEKEALVNGTT